MEKIISQKNIGFPYVSDKELFEMLTLENMTKYAKPEIAEKMSKIYKEIEKKYNEYEESERFALGLEEESKIFSLLLTFKIITEKSEPEAMILTDYGRKYATLLYFSQPEKKEFLANYMQAIVKGDQKEWEKEIKKKKATEKRKKERDNKKRARRSKK